ncbi:cell division/cell wall cluster transcriptional repressor MraZ [Thioclava nitratireducens]|uniref:Transcriptional regulator MraZ n=1 Tax=Thioclava nitratireducens TaxID=1915078 RepID=A0ABM6IGB0_9RHOB|nr:division/cell wall cluster transcriptional repressor MraZ [Thioclava nitratireducens]AQS47750.1 cell division/cell wall cluster transcriptional repressor MraZ [Thioclava nitratireducens]
MFIGEYTFKVDSKGRVSIPALFRRELEEGDPERPNKDRPRMVIVYGADTQKMLQIYTQAAFEALAADIAALPRGSKRRTILQRMVLSKSHPTEVDPDGRLVLPAALRTKIGLDKEAYFSGVGETFEIWNPETFAAADEANIDQWIEEQGEDFDPLSLLSQG